MEHQPRLSSEYPVRSITGVRIISTGSFVPDTVVTNQQLEEKYGYEPGWIEQRTGIRERRVVTPDMATSDLAVGAARRCLEKANVNPHDVDLLVVATFTPDMLLPATANFVQDRLDLKCPAMDLQAACSGFMFALVTGMQYVATGCSKLCLVLGADCNTKVVNPRDKKTYPLFGDASGAVLLAPGEDDQGFAAYTLGTDGSGTGLIRRPMGGTRMVISENGVREDLHYIQMEGRAVFKWAVRVLGDTVQTVVKAANLTLEDIDWFIAHQANLRIIDSAVQSLGISRHKVLTNLERYGNTSAASIPLALDEVCTQGHIRRGDVVLLSGFGAGLAWGTGLFRW
jgi:3-oxoacyl-[acyl-carrier-protein] synthase III